MSATASEKQFIGKMRKKGWKVIGEDQGWPDSFVLKKSNNGKKSFFFVEIKRHSSDWLQENQINVLSTLMEAGLSCYVYTTRDDKLIPANKFIKNQLQHLNIEIIAGSDGIISGMSTYGELFIQFNRYKNGNISKQDFLCILNHYKDIISFNIEELIKSLDGLDNLEKLTKTNEEK